MPRCTNCGTVQPTAEIHRRRGRCKNDGACDRRREKRQLELATKAAA